MSLRSMTAFGTTDLSSGHLSLRCQIKTLNSRYLDVSARLPKIFQAYEADVTAFVKKHLERGKVEISVYATETAKAETLGVLNDMALAHHLQLAARLSDIVSRTQPAWNSHLNGMSLHELLTLDGVVEQPITLSDDGANTNKTALLACIDKAIQIVKAERSREGKSLQAALSDLVGELDSDRQYLQSMSASLLEQIYQNYVKRLDQLLKKMHEANLPTASELNKDRLYLEIGILTDKCDIEEELTRMKTHTHEFLETFKAPEAVGRKLDFLCQEMHREVNTMSNKLVQNEATQVTIRMKLAIERLRQQVQNIE